VLSNGKRCPNEALPGSRYCGLPAHQELALKDTGDDVEPIVAEADPELEAIADAAPPDAESIGPESLADVPEEVDAIDSAASLDGEATDVAAVDRAEPEQVPAGIPVEPLTPDAADEEHSPAA
jgi:transcription termination/antitermination protein NusA